MLASKNSPIHHEQYSFYLDLHSGMIARHSSAILNIPAAPSEPPRTNAETIRSQVCCRFLWNCTLLSHCMLLMTVSIQISL